MEAFIKQINNQVVSRIFKEYTEKISSVYKIDIKELYSILNNQGIEIKYKPVKPRFCKTCKKQNIEKKAIKGSIFCESHKRVNANVFKLQMNRSYKVLWNARTGFVLRGENEKDIIVGKLVKVNGIVKNYTKDLDENDIATCKKYNLKYIPGDCPMPKQKQTKQKNKKKKEKTEEKDELDDNEEKDKVEDNEEVEDEDNEENEEVVEDEEVYYVDEDD